MSAICKIISHLCSTSVSFRHLLVRTYSNLDARFSALFGHLAQVNASSVVTETHWPMMCVKYIRLFATCESTRELFASPYTSSVRWRTFIILLLSERICSPIPGWLKGTASISRCALLVTLSQIKRWVNKGKFMIGMKPIRHVCTTLTNPKQTKWR